MPPRDVSEYLERFESQFPFGAPLRRIFRAAGADPIYARALGGAGADGHGYPWGSWLLLIRLPPNLEERFGITREFLVYCTDVADLQARSITQIRDLIQSVQRPIERDFAVLVTSDNRAPDKIKDWALDVTEGITVLPLPRTTVEATIGTDVNTFLPNVLEQWLFSRDLYLESAPVTGPRFFGRSKERGTLRRAILEGKHIGLFGLRKIGKTSLISEVSAAVSTEGEFIPISIDLQGSSAAGNAAHVAYRIAGVLASELEKSGHTKSAILRQLDVPPKFNQANPDMLFTSVFDGLRELLETLLKNRRLLVALDEAEVLLAPDATMPGALHLFRGLRAVSQETGQISVLLAGVNATPCELPTVDDVDNPLFGYLTKMYLGPLTIDAASEMVTAIGRKVGLRWSGASATKAAAYTGGHPLLTRLLASDVAAALPRPSRVEIGDVEARAADFHTRHSDIFREITQSLVRHYPDEMTLLKEAAAGDVEFARQWRAGNPESASHLDGYGVTEGSEFTIRMPALRAWLRRPE